MAKISSICLLLFCFLSFVSCKTFLEDLTISDKEKRILDQFREKVRDYLPHAYQMEYVYLIRWLRVGFFNMEKAEKLLKDNLRWRAENKIDKIHSENWSDLQKDYPYSLEGRSKDGKPQLFIAISGWDLRRAAISGESDRFLRYVDKIIDEAVSLVRHLGERDHNVSQVTLLLNVKGFNLVTHGCLQCIPLILRIVSTYEAHYPNQADMIIAVNVPAIAQPIVRIIRAALHPITNAAFFVFGTNKNEWMPELEKEYTIFQLPTDLGGKLITDNEDIDYLENFYE